MEQEAEEQLRDWEKRSSALYTAAHHSDTVSQSVSHTDQDQLKPQKKNLGSDAEREKSCMTHAHTASSKLTSFHNFLLCG